MQLHVEQLTSSSSYHDRIDDMIRWIRSSDRLRLGSKDCSEFVAGRSRCTIPNLSPPRPLLESWRGRYTWSIIFIILIVYVIIISNIIWRVVNCTYFQSFYCLFINIYHVIIHLCSSLDTSYLIISNHGCSCRTWCNGFKTYSTRLRLSQTAAVEVTAMVRWRREWIA